MHFKTMIVGAIFLGKMVFAESPVDDFGFQKFYTTLTGSLSWTSAHWNNGNDRTFSDWSTDPDDPTGWTSDQSGSAQGFHVDGSGVMQMLGNVGEKTEFAKYFTFFTLFDANGIVEKTSGAFSGAVVLLIGAVVMYVLGSVIFCRKDLFL